MTNQSDTPIYDAVRTDLQFDPKWSQREAEAVRVRPAMRKAKLSEAPK